MYVRETKIITKNVSHLVDTEIVQKVPSNENEDVKLAPDPVKQPFDLVDGTTIYFNDEINPSSTEETPKATALPPLFNSNAKPQKVARDSPAEFTSRKPILKDLDDDDEVSDNDDDDDLEDEDDDDLDVEDEKEYTDTDKDEDPNEVEFRSSGDLPAKRVNNDTQKIKTCKKPNKYIDAIDTEEASASEDTSSEGKLPEQQQTEEAPVLEHSDDLLQKIEIENENKKLDENLEPFIVSKLHVSKAEQTIAPTITETIEESLNAAGIATEKQTAAEMETVVQSEPAIQNKVNNFQSETVDTRATIENASNFENRGTAEIESTAEKKAVQTHANETHKGAVKQEKTLEVAHGVSTIIPGQHEIKPHTENEKKILNFKKIENVDENDEKIETNPPPIVVVEKKHDESNSLLSGIVSMILDNGQTANEITTQSIVQERETYNNDVTTAQEASASAKATHTERSSLFHEHYVATSSQVLPHNDHLHNSIAPEKHTDEVTIAHNHEQKVEDFQTGEGHDTDKTETETELNANDDTLLKKKLDGNADT